MRLRVLMYFFDHSSAGLLLDIGFFLLPFFLQSFPVLDSLFACKKRLLLLLSLNWLYRHFSLMFLILVSSAFAWRSSSQSMHSLWLDFFRLLFKLVVLLACFAGDWAEWKQPFTALYLHIPPLMDHQKLLRRIILKPFEQIAVLFRLC